MKENILKSSRFAAFAMGIMIILSILIGGHRSLQAKRSAVERLFAEGTDSEPGIGTRLTNIAKESVNLCSTAKRYYDPQDPAILAVEAARSELYEADTPSKKSAALDRLYAAASDLYYKLHDSTPGISEKHKTDAMINHTNIQSEMDKIKHSSYNEQALAFNRILDGFPASLLSGITGITDVELFG